MNLVKNEPVDMTPAEEKKNRTKMYMMAVCAVSCLLFMGVMSLVSSELVYAATNSSSGASTVTSSFSSLTDIVTALVSSIGTIVLLWGFFEWGTSMQSTDGVMQSSAFKRIGGGLIMVLAPQLISAFIS